MEKYYCEIDEKEFLKGPCLRERNGTREGNQTCPRCPYYLSILTPSIKKTQKKKTIKPKLSISSKIKPKNKIDKQEPWRAEAIDLPKNPFTEKQYQAIEKVMKPINGFDLRSKILNAVTSFLTLNECNKERPRISDVKKNLEKIKKMASQLSDFLMNKVDDETLARLGILENVYNCNLEVSKIYYSSIAELRILPTDPGSLNPWKTKPLKFYFQDLAKIYEEGTGRKIKRAIDPMKEKPTKAYKKVLNYFSLCWEPVNPEKKISDGALDSKLKNYLSLTKN